MTSDLSSFAARLREFISRCAEDSAPAPGETAPTTFTPDDAEFNDLALTLFALQFKHNAPYRKFCEARKSFPGSLVHWPEIPALPTSAFKELKLTCLPAAERTTVFHSSGTTEQRPSRHFHSTESLALYDDSLWRWFRAHLLGDLRFTIYDLRPIGRQPQPKEQSPIANRQSPIILTPPPSMAPHSSLVHMCEVVRRELGSPTAAFVGETAADGTWALNVEAALAALRAGAEGRCPLILLGTAFSFVHLLDLLAERNLRFELPAGSRVMETGGYKGRSRSLSKTEFYGLIIRKLGVPDAQIICEYGMSELSSQAYDLEFPTLDSPPKIIATKSHEKAQNSLRPFAPLCGQQIQPRLFRFPPWARAQIISPETGREVAGDESGLLRIFDLANVFSVMAIQTEDLGVRRGNGFEVIGRAEAAEPRGCSLMLQSPIGNSAPRERSRQSAIP